jgi:acetyl-CoA synthetase
VRRRRRLGDRPQLHRVRAARQRRDRRDVRGHTRHPTAEHRIGDRASWPKDRFWDIIERYGVTQLYTAPTAIRTFMKWGAEEPARHDLSSLRVLGTVGEPINPEAWMWYHEHIGAERCPIVDTWWQTETGAT